MHRRAASSPVEVGATLRELEARRAILVSEPGAWAAVGERLADDLGERRLAGRAGAPPAGRGCEAAVRHRGRGAASWRGCASSAASRSSRSAAARSATRPGFLAATYLRGVPFVQVPTTLVAQLDSSIGGKTGVDLPEGKNLVGAFHQPAAILIDVSVLASLDVRQRRAALAEAVKMAALGDERLFETLEATARRSRPATARRSSPGRSPRSSSGRRGRRSRSCSPTSGRRRADRAEPRALAGPRDRGGRGLPRPPPRRGGRVRPARGGANRRRSRRRRRRSAPTRIEALLDGLELGVAPLALDLEAVLELLATDKKHAGGALRWVLPTADGHAIDAEVPDGARARGRGRGPGRASDARAAAAPRDDPDPRPPGPEPEPARDARAGDLRLGDARPDPRAHRPAARSISGSR